MYFKEAEMRPQVDKSWRKRSPAYHKSAGEKRIEAKQRREIEKQILEHKAK